MEPFPFLGVGPTAVVIGILSTLFLAAVVTPIRMVFTGMLVTRREHDALRAECEAKDHRIELLVKVNEEDRKTISGFSAAIETSNAMIQAIMMTAQERDRGS